MVRIVAATVLGAAVLFVWNAVSWTLLPMVMPWHEIRQMPRENDLIKALTTTKAPTGVYRIPWISADPEESGEERRAAFDAMKQKHVKGPVALVVYSAEGSEPLPFSMHPKGFLMYLGGSAAASIMLAMARSTMRNYFLRVLFVAMLGFYVAATSNLTAWNYHAYPLEFSLQVAGDSLVGAILLGFTIAGVIRRGP
jgi:hypothetical protein